MSRPAHLIPKLEKLAASTQFPAEREAALERIRALKQLPSAVVGEMPADLMERLRWLKKNCRHGFFDFANETWRFLMPDSSWVSISNGEFMEYMMKSDPRKMMEYLLEFSNVGTITR